MGYDWSMSLWCIAYNASSRRSETPSLSKTLCNELNNFFLAVAEQRLFAARACFAGLRKRLHHFGGHAIVEPDFAGMYTMNAFHQEIRGGLFQHDAAGSKTHGADHVAIVFSGGQNDDARGQRIEINFFEDGQAVFIRHAQVKEQDIRFELGEELDALRTVLRFTHNGDIFVGIEKLPQAIAKDRMVIG